MKKGMRWVTSTIVFLICGVLIFGKISDIVRAKTGQTVDMMRCLYEQSSGGGTADVVCLGSSHGYWAVQSNYLWDQYGMTSLVMCSPRQTVASSYYVLKEVLKYEKPKVVLLESYYFYFGGKYVDEDPQVQIRKAFDGLRMDEVKYEMIQDFLGDKPFKEKLSYYIPFLQYHSRWSDLRSYDFNNWYFLRGSALNFGIYPMEKPGLPEQPSEISQTNREYLEKLKLLCEENEIELVVFAAPMGADEDPQKYMKKQGYNVALETYLEELNIPFLFFQKMPGVSFDFSTDFVDSMHLNTMGGIKLSQYLGAWLQQQYAIEDHRGDERYHSYDEDFEKYQKVFERKQNASE